MGIASALMKALRGTPEAAGPAIRFASGVAPDQMAIHKALADIELEHPGNWADSIAAIGVGPDPNLRDTLGAYYPQGLNGNWADPDLPAIRLDSDLLSDEEHILGTLSHESQHHRDAMEGLPFDDGSTPYWNRPEERRAFNTELGDVLRVRARNNRQPFLFDRPETDQLIDNQVSYGMDTLAQMQALQAALEGKDPLMYGPGPTIPWQTLRSPEQQSLDI